MHPSETKIASDFAQELAEPEAAAEMASAVERVRRMAATVFDGDAALFAEATPER